MKKQVLVSMFVLGLFQSQSHAVIDSTNSSSEEKTARIQWTDEMYQKLNELLQGGMFYMAAGNLLAANPNLDVQKELQKRSCLTEASMSDKEATAFLMTYPDLDAKKVLEKIDRLVVACGISFDEAINLLIADPDLDAEKVLEKIDRLVVALDISFDEAINLLIADPDLDVDTIIAEELNQ